MPTIAQIAAQVRPLIREVQAEQVHRDRTSAAPPRIVDVREQNEWDAGHIPGAELIPLGTVAQVAPEKLPRKDESIVVHCAAGVRSAVAAYQLQQLGYTNVSSMAGGFSAWRELGLPIEAPLTRAQLDRYSRHVLIPEVGVEGQRTLLASKVLVIGAGGLGSPAAYYLAAAGVGTLGIVDSDVVDVTNLQRQILHSTDRIGEHKAESAKRTLQALDPDITIAPYVERLTAGNVDRILASYDVIVDGADNFPTRYLLNDASVKWRKPVVHGSVYRFEGQVTVFKPYEGPCYRCLFPEPPPPELAPSCEEAGVLGVLPGIIGTVQAAETIKLLLGVGEPLVGRLLLFDALEMSFHEVKLRRDPKCPVCGEHPTITDYIDYEGFCASPADWREQHEAVAGKTA
ncbi:MAG: molybdopterin-synthase adenylyltransferase MoeB [Chloroflexi bacterium]|nr:molybdopterin-synthase adenylyltransferase MoeB [Chloroflexota bacterium]